MSQVENNFLWGVATSANQVEGHIKSEWTKWEKETAEERAEGAYQNLINHSAVLGRFSKENWERIKDTARNPQNYIRGRSTRHQRLFKQDFEIIKTLGLNAYRFSVEWAKIEPEEGKYNQKEINRYRQMVEYLLELGITPVITLVHFTHPIWFIEKGGWLEEKNIESFKKFSKLVVTQIAPEVKYWLILNEPLVYAGHTYITGNFPTKKIGQKYYNLCLSNFSKAIREVSKMIKVVSKDYQVGFAHNVIDFKEKDKSLITKLLHTYIENTYNLDFLRKNKKYIDFIGINNYTSVDISIEKVFKVFTASFYGRIKVIESNEFKEVFPVSDLGWKVDVSSLANSVKKISKFKLPILITEHGIADATDTLRGWFVSESLKKLGEVIRTGVNVIGYLHWSLLDNFELDVGKWPKFGLVEVDYSSFRRKRKIRESAFTYSEIAKNNPKGPSTYI